MPVSYCRVWGVQRLLPKHKFRFLSMETPFWSLFMPTTEEHAIARGGIAPTLPLRRYQALAAHSCHVWLIRAQQDIFLVHGTEHRVGRDLYFAAREGAS